VTDAALGFRKLAAAAGARTDEPQLCNLGTGRSNEVGDVVRFIAKAAGIDLTIEQDAARVRAVDRPMLKASTSRLESLTGWKPGTSLEEGMRRAWSTRALDKLIA
jgi:UDP-glucose 4-epimerase